ncbi:MAG: IS1595 family transposase [bacterium]
MPSTKTEKPLPAARDLKNLDSLTWMFPGTEECLAYLVKLRWSNGFICNACNFQGEPWMRSLGTCKCPECHKQIVVTAGTVFYRSNVPLPDWFRAAWELLRSDISVWGKHLQNVMDIEDQAARRILRSLRSAMGTSNLKLSGEIQVDEFEMECRVDPRKGRSGKGVVTCYILVAAEATANGALGRVRMHQVLDLERKTIHPLICQWVTPGATIRTDDWRGYRGLSYSTNCIHKYEADLGVDHKKVAMLSGDIRN